MIKVAFWSSAPKNGVSVNLASLATIGAQEYPLHVTMMENHLDRDGLGRMLLGCRWDSMVREPECYYSTGAADIHRLKGGLSAGTNRRFFDAEFVDLVENRLSYVWQNYMVSPELYEFEFCRKMLPRFDSVKRNIEEVYFIDTSSRQNTSTMEILNQADLIVVNLVQSPLIVDGFFEKYGSLLDKCVFLISDYRRRSPITRASISSRYGIPQELIARIPHSEGLKQAVYDGDIAGFITDNIRASKDSGEYYLINEMRHGMKMIVNRMLEISASGRRKGGRMTVGEFKRQNIVMLDGRNKLRA